MGFFSSALCYCTAELLSSCVRPSDRRPSVRKTRFLRNHETNSCQILGQTTCPPYLKTLFLGGGFKILNFQFVTIFCFSLTWDHMEEKISNVSSESTHQIQSPKIIHTPVVNVSTKVVQRIVKFQIWNFFQFFFPTFDC